MENNKFNQLRELIVNNVSINCCFLSNDGKKFKFNGIFFYFFYCMFVKMRII